MPFPTKFIFITGGVLSSLGKGLASAAKKAGRSASEGVIHSYIHSNNKIGVLVEVNCETDFVAKTEDFKGFVNDVSMHIAAMSPRYLQKEEVTEDDLAREREIYKQQALDSGKPEKIVDKIVDGKMNKFYSEVCLLEQAFVKDDKMTIEDLRK